MSGPQRAGVAAGLGHDDVSADRLGDLIQQRRAIDRLRPRLRLWKRDRAALHAAVVVAAKARPLGLHQLVEDRRAKPSASAAALRSCSYLIAGSFASRAISVVIPDSSAPSPATGSSAGCPFRRGLDGLEELRPDGIVLEPVADVVAVAAIRKQIDDLDRRRDVIQGLGDLLRVLAAGLVGVGQDHDAPVLEVLGQLGIPFRAGAFARTWWRPRQALLARLSASFSPSQK